MSLIGTFRFCNDWRTVMPSRMRSNRLTLAFLRVKQRKLAAKKLAAASAAAQEADVVPQDALPTAVAVEDSNIVAFRDNPAPDAT